MYRIGVSQCSRDDWREKMNDEILREVMFHDGEAEVEILSADDDNDRQIADIEYFADNGFDIIIASPNEAAALTPVIEQMHRRGIPVIIFDRDINSDNYTAHIGADNEGLGRAAASYATGVLGRSGKAVEIYGLPGSTPAELRHKGFAEQYLGSGGAIVATLRGNWNKDDAKEALDSVLRHNADIDLIFAHNDRMAIGASEVATALGRRNEIKIVGIDAAPEIGIRAVADSVIDATFLYPTEGHRLIRMALSILKGEPYERVNVLPVSSAVDLSNADVLLLQNEALSDETDKIKMLKLRIDDYWRSHSMQTMLFYAALVILLLFSIAIFLILRAFWQHRRHQSVLMEQNKLLQEERDKHKTLNEKLQEATQSKLMFFTNVSHDLRTPLTLIGEPVSQLADAPNLTSEQRTMLALADKNVRILRRLINQILDFRKYENGRHTLNLCETDLGQAIGDWVDGFRPLVRRRQMTLNYNAPATGTVVAAVDTEKMERIMFNLVSNAIKYTPDGGKIDVNCAIEGSNVVISVSDTGRGIEQRDLGNIFDRFYQVDRVHPNGSGIGLSLTKAFVEMHEGSISVASSPGQGSVFTVTLPVRHVSDTAVTADTTITAADIDAELGIVSTETCRAANTADTDADKSESILVIDDNRDIQVLIRGILGQSYNIMCADNGEEGLSLASEHVPDLIICDIMMTGIDGLECCRRLKSTLSTSHIPVLMLTACTMDEQRVQGYDCGADGYLAKPFNASVLIAQCKSLISNRKRIHQLWSAPESSSTAAERKQDEDHADKIRDIDNTFYHRFLQIFTADMGNPEIGVDTLASRMGLERSQFYRKIKSLTGMSPIELIRKLRLEYARQQLSATDLSISEIAYAAGYSTPAYFTKCFRETYGMTPGDFRKHDI